MADKKVNPIGNAMGLLRIRVIRGINLAVRDVKSSDPYVIVRLGKQVLFFILIVLTFHLFFSIYMSLIFHLHMVGVK